MALKSFSAGVARIVLKLSRPINAGYLVPFSLNARINVWINGQKLKMKYTRKNGRINR
jgi:hypothetical protein